MIVGTDGLWEARDEQGEMFSVERFRQVLATWHNKTAEEICCHMLSLVKNYANSGEGGEDDMTLMIIKVPQHPIIGP